MNHITLGKSEVVITDCDFEIVINMDKFKEMMTGLLIEEDVHFADVSMDIGESQVYFFNDETEVAVPLHHAMDIAMHLC